MQLSIKHKFAFLCIPKCGSTSVEKAIRPYCEAKLGGHPALKHLNLNQFNRCIRPLLGKVDPDREIETFCIMREPIERIESWYHYQMREQLADSGHRGHDRYTGGLTFTQFVEGYLADEQPEYARISTQAKFIRVGNKAIGVDHLFHLGDMDAVSDFLSERIGTRIEIPKANQSSGKKSGAGKPLWKRLKKSLRNLVRGSTVAPANESPRPSLELPEPLMLRLKAHLAEDYLIYNRLLEKQPVAPPSFP